MLACVVACVVACLLLSDSAHATRGGCSRGPLDAQVTNARASTDYAGDVQPFSASGPHNWAVADNTYVFWASLIAPSKDNFWTTFDGDIDALGFKRNTNETGMDAELHAICAILSTGPVGIGNYINATNRTLLQRLARSDGTLLRPDRPLIPMDSMWGLLTTPRSPRGMPNNCYAFNPSAHCGAHLWQTTASVGVESAVDAPELTTSPTRRLVSHTSVDDMRYRTVASLYEGEGLPLHQHLVVSVDQNDSFWLRRGDFYPSLANASTVLWRRATDGGSPCVNGTDAVETGCVTVANATSGLMDVSTQHATCSQGGIFGRMRSEGCMHAVEVWQLFPVPVMHTRHDGRGNASQTFFLGDLSAYVSLSGYRFRRLATDASKLVVVGAPGEAVTLTFVCWESSAWIVRSRTVIVGDGGRTVTALQP